MIHPQLLVAPVPSVSHTCTQVVTVLLLYVHAGSVSQTPPSTHSDPPVPSVDLSNIPDDGTLGESRSNAFSVFHYFVSL